MTRRDINEENIVRQGLASAALTDSAVSGQVASVTDGELEFVDAGASGSQSYVTGSGSPVGTVTPTAAKPLYIDTTNGTAYLALGATDLDWVALGPVAGNVGEATGLIVQGPGRDLYVLGGDRDAAGARTAYIGDAYSQWNGHQQGLVWRAGPGEGAETLTVTTGTTGQHVGTLQDGSGGMSVPGTLTAGGLAFTGDIGLAGNDLTDVGQVVGGGGENIAFDGAGTINLTTSGTGDVILSLPATGDRLAVEPGETNIENDAVNVKCNDGGGLRTMIAVQFGKLGFFGASADAQPVIPATPTEQDIVDALVTLGLVTQAA